MSACTNGDTSLPHIGDGNRQLDNRSISKYNRQAILPEIGVRGQKLLQDTSVLVIGAGGLGCPAAAYLAGAGIGKIGIVESDIVDYSNLHRQIIYNHANHGESKAENAHRFIAELNPDIKCTTYQERFTATNAERIASNFEIILDCTDNPASRYLISDVAVLLQKPLVTASAARTEGQLMVLNFPPLPAGDETGGPCYRCIFPIPSPVETVVTCDEGGILGPVVGMMGVMQALETIKLIVREWPRADWCVARYESWKAQKKNEEAPEAGSCTMHLFSAYWPRPFRTLQVAKSRRLGCAGCSFDAIKDLKTFNYNAFCGMLGVADQLPDEFEVTAKKAHLNLNGDYSTMIDVRERPHFDLCNLKGSLNIPWSEMTEWKTRSDIPAYLRTARKCLHIICRRGNDSQLAVRMLQSLGFLEENMPFGGKLLHVRGGFVAWRMDVDPGWPDY